MWRVEDKFAFDDKELFYLQAKMETVLKPDKNQNTSYGYTITSVYFDDYQDKHLKDSIDGNRIREKYRIRIYNGSYNLIKLEVKYKRDNRAFKRSLNITKEQMRTLMNGECIIDDAPSADNAITLFNLAICQRKLAPVIIVEYDRKAFVFDAGNVRITLDRHLRFSENLSAFKDELQYTRIKVTKPDSILEVKYDEFLPGFIAGILESGNMHQEAYSKYRLCREEALVCQ